MRIYRAIGLSKRGDKDARTDVGGFIGGIRNGGCCSYIAFNPSYPV
jgi:hypothetical protein